MRSLAPKFQEREDIAIHIPGAPLRISYCAQTPWGPVDGVVLWDDRPTKRARALCRRVAEEALFRFLEKMLTKRRAQVAPKPRRPRKAA